MAWQHRGKYRYYYRTRHRDGQVYKEYFGRGQAAKLAAQADAVKQAEREACRAMDSRLDAAERPATTLDAMCGLLMQVVLLAAGFYRQDKHAWRRRSA